MSRMKVSAALVVLLLAACAGDAAEDDVDVGTIPPAVDGLPRADTSLVQTTPEEAGAETLRVAVTDDAITLTPATVAPGLVSLNVTNTGSSAHRFKLSGTGEDVETDELAPGADVMVTMNLTAGTYQAVCSMEGHDHGPAATLTVR